MGVKGVVRRQRYAALVAVVLAVAGLGCMAQSAAAAVGDISYDGCVSADGSGGLCAVASPALFGPEGVAVSPNGGSVYVASYHSVTHFFAAPQGQLSYDGCISDDGTGGSCVDAPGSPFNNAQSVAVSPDGRSVYVVGTYAGTVDHFFAAPQGQLSYDGCISNDGSGGLCVDAPGSPLDHPTSVAVSPDGKSVYVTSGVSNSIAHFFVAPQGQLSYDGCVSSDGSGGFCADAPGTPLDGADGVAVSPDSRSVYVVSGFSNTVTHFFAAPQGQLSYDGCVSDNGSGGLCADAPGSPLNAPTAVAVSPDGRSVYTTSGNGNAVVHFTAAPQGQVTYDSCISDSGSGGSCFDAPGTPLTSPRALAVSPDGASVYVASLTSASIARFSVGSGGKLTYVGCASDDGSAGLCTDLPGNPLLNTAGVAVSPNGGSVYATAAVGEDIAHFFRATTGGGGGGGGSSTPTLSGLTISPQGFAAAKSGASVAKATGAKVSFSLNIAAGVRFTVQRTVTGRRQNGKCLATTHKNRHHSHCQRVIKFGSFTVNGVAGANSFHFTGRVSGHRLGSGGYTLVAVPSAGGKTGKQASVHFSIHS